MVKLRRCWTHIFRLAVYCFGNRHTRGVREKERSLLSLRVPPTPRLTQQVDSSYSSDALITLRAQEGLHLRKRNQEPRKSEAMWPDTLEWTLWEKRRMQIALRYWNFPQNQSGVAFWLEGQIIRSWGLKCSRVSFLSAPVSVTCYFGLPGPFEQGPCYLASLKMPTRKHLLSSPFSVSENSPGSRADWKRPKQMWIWTGRKGFSTGLGKKKNRSVCF